MIENKEDNVHWTLPRRVPLSVILMLLAQLGGILVWATQLDARVSDMEHASVDSVDLNGKFTRLEERLDNVKQDIEGVKHQIDHLTDKLLKP